MNENALWLAIVAAFVGILTPVFTSYAAYKMAQLKQNGDLVMESNRVAMLKLDHIKTTTEKTLTHVNDQFLIQLRLHMESTEIVAKVRNAPGDQEIADAAKKMFEEHEQKQKEASQQKS